MVPWLSALLRVLVPLGLAALRLTPSSLLLPYLGGRVLPNQARIPLLLVLAAGLWPASLDAVSQGISATVAPLSFALLLQAVLREAALGVVLAVVLAVPFWALEQAGALLDQARGANASEFLSPEAGTRSSPLAELLRWTFLMVFSAAGGLRAFCSVFAASFVAFPPVVEGSTWNATMWFLSAIQWTGVALAASVTFAGAGLLALAATELTLGIASRFSPPLAQSQVALPLRTMVPLLLLALTVGAWTGAAMELSHLTLSAARGLLR